ncbi:Na+/H+ antiporter NhaC [Fulvivirgaceae bacterium BMA10]|uniref:Na+/H+ antiporter NhaC n=1 Tax=Splendidivirga corallicola TaxID=3051826 RepID=A0ABT8KS57_9BACT|nr:Na+/H+ antiporter NhaC [Fulvivirgaceae bacterium BMA10]
MTQASEKNVPFIHLLLPIIFLTILIVYGLILQPRLFNQPAFPLEIVFLLATVFSAAHLLIIGYKWEVIQHSIVKKLAKGFPAVLILFAIGIIIGTWIVSGTIPMLIYYGIKLVDPNYMYILAFIVPIIFSTLTGTSWGSVGTIGAVIIGVAASVNAHMGITAGAIVGGAYFGDKMSPLSDTTNLASMAVEIDLYDHIRSMMYTTVPSAIIAAIIYFALGFMYPPQSGDLNGSQISDTLQSIGSIFNFNIFLLIPPIIVLYGSLRKMATLPTLLTSSIISCILALIFQDFGIKDIMETLKSGFNTNMATSATAEIPERIEMLFNRGGLFELNEVIVFTLMVLTFIGTIDVTDAMPRIVNKVFAFTKTRSAVILSSLVSAAFTNSITSNQSATSFIVGDAFKKRYDQFKISRRVLSRSIEDYGTMIESIVPWTATALFMSTTLGVAFSDYWHWQLLSLINIVVAPTLAILGIGCFYEKQNK